VSILSNPTNDVAVLQLGEQTREIGWVVLEIGIQGGDDRAGGGPEAGIESGRLAGVLGQSNDADPSVRGGQVREDLRTFIRAAVVDIEDFVVHPLLGESRSDLSVQRTQILGLIEDRHDDGKVFWFHGSRRLSVASSIPRSEPV